MELRCGCLRIDSESPNGQRRHGTAVWRIRGCTPNQRSTRGPKPPLRARGTTILLDFTSFCWRLDRPLGRLGTQEFFVVTAVKFTGKNWASFAVSTQNVILLCVTVTHPRAGR